MAGLGEQVIATNQVLMLGALPTTSCVIIGTADR